jgi:hypothetical protein
MGDNYRPLVRIKYLQLLTEEYTNPELNHANQVV